MTPTDPDIGNNAIIAYSIKEVCAKSTVSGSCIDIDHLCPFALDTESELLRVRQC